MGNYITTRTGVTVDLNIPATITSFNTNTSSHVTSGKLKVFFIGSTGDKRVFTKSFAEDLISTLPGAPIVAYYDEESDDFVGHNDEQYVYGYVPEDAIPEFVEEDGKTWAVVDVNLFTERQDKIGEIANKIIGKSQSLELNPETVDWELIYINGKLERIVFKKGSFYGLSVLGDNQQPAFTGSGFFTEQVIEDLKSFQKQDNGGSQIMNKTEFLSLGIDQKRQKFDTIITDKGAFDYFYVIDFTEEDVIVQAIVDGELKYYAAPYAWSGEDTYEIGDFDEVIPSFVKKQSSSNPSTGFITKEEEEILEQVKPVSEESEGSDDEKESEQNPQEDDNAPLLNSEPEGADNANEGADNANEGADNAAEGEGDGDGGEGSSDGGEGSFEEKEEEKEDSDRRDCNEQDYEEEEKKKKPGCCEENAANASTLSSEERDELNELRREKKMSLINEYKEFLSEDSVNDVVANIDNYDLITLERELKVMSFDANIKKIQNKEGNSFNVVLPTVQKQYSNSTEQLIADILKR